MPAILDKIWGVQDTAIDKIWGALSTSIESVWAFALVTTPTPDQTVAIDMQDGSWQDQQVPTNWNRQPKDYDTVFDNDGALVNLNGDLLDWSYARDSNAAGLGDGAAPASRTYDESVYLKGNCEGYGTTHTYSFNGLNDSNTYTFYFWGNASGDDRTWENVNGRTYWTIGSSSVYIVHIDYDGYEVSIADVAPSGGTIDIVVSRTIGTFWYFKWMVVEEYS